MTSGFIEKRLPEILSNTVDPKPEIPDVFIEISPEDTDPLEPRKRVNNYRSWAISRFIYSRTIIPDKIESGVLKEQPKVSIPKKMARTLEKPKKPKLRESGRNQVMQNCVLPRYILSTGQPFLFEIPKDSLDEFYSFRWVNQPPKGMYFLYDRKAINWVPTEKQLDAFQVSYVARMKVDEIMESTRGTEDSSQGVFKTLPVLGSREENMWIYVNDPPRFLTKPTITEFTAGSTFRYEPIVQDKNKDSNIKFDLEVFPEGMTFEDGVLKWETDSSHVEVYDVRLVATDGFERTAQEFKLYSRAGVKILSKAPQKASVGNDYNYAVRFGDKTR